MLPNWWNFFQNIFFSLKNSLKKKIAKEQFCFFCFLGFKNSGCFTSIHMWNNQMDVFLRIVQYLVLINSQEGQLKGKKNLIWIFKKIQQ
jgi:hypothetical protein